MGLREARMMSEAFTSGHFRKVVDLGCGDGALGRMLRHQADYLIGVDNNPYQLDVARQGDNYDELVLSNIENYQIPMDTDAVFMIESIEHIPKDEGFTILSSLRSFPTVVVTTPDKFCPHNGHVSLWTRDELESFGLSTYLLNRPIRFEEIWLGKGIIAIKSPLNTESLSTILAQIDAGANINTALTVGVIIGSGLLIYHFAKKC